MKYARHFPLNIIRQAGQYLFVVAFPETVHVIFPQSFCSLSWPSSCPQRIRLLRVIRCLSISDCRYFAPFHKLRPLGIDGSGSVFSGSNPTDWGDKKDRASSYLGAAVYVPELFTSAINSSRPMRSRSVSISTSSKLHSRLLGTFYPFSSVPDIDSRNPISAPLRQRRSAHFQSVALNFSRTRIASTIQSQLSFEQRVRIARSTGEFVDSIVEVRRCASHCRYHRHADEMARAIRRPRFASPYFQVRIVMQVPARSHYPDAVTA
jgi:hypothetical protein